MSNKSNYHDTIWKEKKSKDGLNENNEKVIQLLEGEKIKSILDVGCGEGNLLIELKKKRLNVQGIDISEEALEKAKQRKLNVKKADLDKGLPLNANSFDAVITVSVLQHLFEPQKLINEMQKVSKKLVIINVPNHFYWKYRIKYLFGKHPDTLKSEHSHIRIFSRSKIIEMIKKSSLKIEKVNYTGNFLKKMFPNLFATSFSFKCHK